jgi:hypothetical protein
VAKNEKGDVKMKLEEGQIITFNREISKQFLPGTMWMVDIASNGIGQNAILLKLKNNGEPASPNVKRNFGAISEESALKLTANNLITID